ncbi:uncharacterized protein ACBT57_013212 [Dama dama]
MASGPMPQTAQGGAAGRPERAGGLPKAAQPDPGRGSESGDGGPALRASKDPERPAGPPAGPGPSRWIAVTGEPRRPEGGPTPTARSHIGWWGSDWAGGARAAQAPFAGSPRKRTRVCTGPAHRHKAPPTRQDLSFTNPAHRCTSPAHPQTEGRAGPDGQGLPPLSRPAALRLRPQRGPGAPHASVPGVCAAVPWGRRDWGLAARGWDSCCAHRPRISPDPGTPKSPAPEDLAHPRALRAPQISGPLCLESSAHPGISVSPRSPWPWGSCAPGPLLPRSLAPREPAGPVQSARPSAVRGPAWGALPLAKATLGAAFASCLLPAPRPPPEPLPGLLPRLSSGSKRSKKLDAIDCALRGPKDSENVKKPLPSRLRRRE